MDADFPDMLYVHYLRGEKGPTGDYEIEDAWHCRPVAEELMIPGKINKLGVYKLVGHVDLDATPRVGPVIKITEGA